MYENWHLTKLQLLLVAIVALIIGCSSGERRINPAQADWVIPVSATVRDICFSPDDGWIVAATRKIKDREYDQSCIAYNIESAQSVEIPQNIDSVCRWGNGFLSTTGQQIFSFSLGADGGLTVREESQLSEFPLHMLGSGRMASNETTIAVAPVWIQKSDVGQACIPSEKIVFGAGVEAERLRTALLKLEPKGIDIHCASITCGPRPTVAITYPTSKAWQIAVLRLDADESIWNTILAGKLPGYHEPMGDEPYDIALRCDGQRVAAVGAEAKQVIVLALPEGKIIWSKTCKSGGANFETAMLFRGPQSIAYSKDGTLLFVATREGGLVLDATNGTTVAKLAVPVTAVACDVKGDLFAFATTEQVEIYSTRLLKR